MDESERETKPYRPLKASRAALSSLAAALLLSTALVSTSHADTFKFTEEVMGTELKDGILYHHIIDTRTGFPARGCKNVTILAPDTIISDALSTAVFVLGATGGYAFGRKSKGR